MASLVAPRVSVRLLIFPCGSKRLVGGWGGLEPSLLSAAAPLVAGLGVPSLNGCFLTQMCRVCEAVTFPITVLPSTLISRVSAVRKDPSLHSPAYSVGCVAIDCFFSIARVVIHHRHLFGCSACPDTGVGRPFQLALRSACVSPPVAPSPSLGLHTLLQVRVLLLVAEPGLGRCSPE